MYYVYAGCQDVFQGVRIVCKIVTTCSIFKIQVYEVEGQHQHSESVTNITHMVLLLGGFVTI